jgi:enoyl-CoA hydratase/carnithine racemase
VDIASFDERYNKRFPVRWEFERTEDGILLVTWKQPDTTLRDEEGFSMPFYANGEGPAISRGEAVWNEISNDPENKVVILTGHNGVFTDNHDHRLRQGFWSAKQWHGTLYGLPRSLISFLDIPSILIGAAVGPASVHAEYLLMCDLVVAAESAWFQDMPHFTNNTVPGDGVNIVWPLLLGWNRGRDFLLTGRKISAHEALDLGLVREVVPDKDLLPRCHELARELLQQDDIVLRLTAPAMRQQLKVHVMQFLQHSLALEGLAFMEQSHAGPSH